jgi:hypothetical protein
MTINLHFQTTPNIRLLLIFQSISITPSLRPSLFCHWNVLTTKPQKLQPNNVPSATDAKSFSGLALKIIKGSYTPISAGRSCGRMRGGNPHVDGDKETSELKVIYHDLS